MSLRNKDYDTLVKMKEDYKLSIIQISSIALTHINKLEEKIKKIEKEIARREKEIK